ncbi:HAD family hydrolase [Parasphaerochaeta coccoides]|uniref:HAD-superfamily hydrolase, subfamily IA, variant 3 n=1 Tax=Parasphaerochaeta coccoides (strain ATCC BAA-1237 / DSM 17374 / SPN1) TaxID=760011 RepID=F4GJY9_PARC1|nr:HAD-IA family hydrolase [Parasphaerochaeta coccoides]AEC01414.1 HAD-superfamily hydrolase, subfamily IA, variant 3 [Parasphaerochaeta coccoides DSM 17374]
MMLNSALGHSLFIFDMGNVVVRNITVLRDISSRWNLPWQEIQDDYCHYEFPLMDGTMSPEDYWKHIRHKFGVTVSGEPFADWFKPVPNDPMVFLLKYLRSQGKRVVCGSNTFAPHWQILEEKGFLRLFDALYPSHLIGLSKPSRFYFSHILEAEGQEPDDTYFVDDLLENIDAARSMGIHCLHYAQTDISADDALMKAFGSEATGLDAQG